MATMKPSDRIKLIKKIQGLTNKLPTHELELIYHQFGMEYNGSMNNTGSWVIKPNFDVAGETLQELYDHLVSDGDAIDSKKEEPSCWVPNRLRLFLSHVSEDKKQVVSIKLALAQCGISAFVAHQDIEPTKEWVDVILGALETCHALAALLTPNFHQSKWTDQEIGYCIRRGVPILPVRLGIDPYGFLGRFQGLPGSSKPEVVAEQIYSVLAKKPKVAHILAAASVDQFINCKSFEMSHQYLNALKRLPADILTQEQRDSIETAVQTNPKLKGAHFMVDKVRTFLDTRK